MGRRSWCRSCQNLFGTTKQEETQSHNNCHSRRESGNENQGVRIVFFHCKTALILPVLKMIGSSNDECDKDTPKWWFVRKESDCRCGPDK